MVLGFDRFCFCCLNRALGMTHLSDGPGQPLGASRAGSTLSAGSKGGGRGGEGGEADHFFVVFLGIPRFIP